VDHSAKALELEFERLSRQLKQERVEAEARLGVALEHAREEGRLAANLAAEASVNRALEGIHTLLRALEEKTLHYTEQVEREVVMLALGIAARILRHECQVDRLLIAGAVRATLDAMREGGKVTVRVPQPDLAAWQMHLEKICFEGKQVSVEGDSTMKAGECLCEFTTGRLDLGLAGQLGEIERAFENILGRGKLPENNAFANGVQDRATSNA
jgi:flagellar assembly protein FliH